MPPSGAAVPGAPLPKRYRAGTHRGASPDETLARVRPFLPILGITRIANITGLDTIGIPVVMVCRPNARSLSVSQGKALDLLAARASGVMESIETWHAENIVLPLKLGSYDELRFTHRMANVVALPRLPFGGFNPDRRLLWIEGHDVVQGAPAWVPFEAVSLDFSLPLLGHTGTFLPGSRGLASGNNLLEAVSHGVCELVEHDATTLWHGLGEAAQQRTRLDLNTVDDPACREALDRYARAAIDVAVWETTTDIGIPAFRCAIADRCSSPLRPGFFAGGMGCHPCRDVALLRALTEAAQSRVTFISGARDDVQPRVYEQLRDPEALRRTQATMRVSGPRRSFRDVPTFDGETFDEDLRWTLDRLQAAGICEVVVVDLTRREFRVPVVRVLIPGLECLHDTPGYVPGARARRQRQGREA